MAQSLPDPTQAAVPRTAGRMLVLDPVGCVLLLEHRLDIDADETVWAAPGGGCEPGESPLEAAVRELAEECGISARPESGESVHVEVRRWYFQGVAYDQTDHFFVARVDRRPGVIAAHRTEWEERTVLGHHWFAAADLLGSSIRYEPADLLPVLAGLR